MDTNQIYSIVNSVAQQTMGDVVLTATDTASLVAMGNAILSSSTNTEAFIDTLVQRIGKTIISYRPYKSKLGLLAVSDMTMGAIMQKVKVTMPTAVEDVTTQLIDGQSIDQYIVSKPVAHQKLFVKRTPYTFYITIQKKWLREAFTSETAMGSFISAIYGEVENALELSQENLARLCMANFMCNIATPTRMCNLVAKYNTASGESVPTGPDALTYGGFLRYALKVIKSYSKRMETMSVLYNDGTEQRHTPIPDQRFVSLIDFQTALETQVEWAAFNEQYVQKMTGIEVPYWQSALSPFDVDLLIEDPNDPDNPTNVTLQNIVGILYDRDALGTYRKEVEVATTPLNARGLYTNQFWHMNDLYFNDVTENGIIFTLN